MSELLMAEGLEGHLCSLMCYDPLYVFSSLPKSQHISLNSLTQLNIGLPWVEQLLFLQVVSLPRWFHALYSLPIPFKWPDGKRDTSWEMLELGGLPYLVFNCHLCLSMLFCFIFHFPILFVYCILPLLYLQSLPSWTGIRLPSKRS